MSCAASPCAARVRIAPAGTAEEKRADLVADAVMGRGVQPTRGAAPGTSDRAAEGAGEALHLSRVGGAPAAGAAIEAACAVGGAGAPMPPDLRAYFEPRFGADLGGVRLHRDDRTAAAAQGIGARAFARGRDIGFARGAYAPDTAPGLRLIAHELAHVLRPDGQVHRQQEDEEPDPPRDTVPHVPNVLTETFRDRSGGGSTDFEEIVETRPMRAGNHVQGRVLRREIAPMTETEDREVISNKRRLVDFNTAACEVTLPYTFRFRRSQGDPDNHNCQGAPMAGRPDVDAIADRYVAAVNAGLNDQFRVRLSGCDDACAGREMPIRIRASRAQQGADKTIEVVPRGGRGSSRYLCAGNFDAGFAVHEAGHQILGRGDEYRERSAASLRKYPNRRRHERVRNDNNYLGSRHRWGRFGTFHERDFRHVQTFLRAVYPGCDVELLGVPQRTPSFRPFATAGLGGLGGGLSTQVSAGLDLGIPLTRDRRWQALVGAEARYLAQLAPRPRRLVLAGMRVGLERQIHGDNATFRLFAAGQVGLSYEPEREVGGDFGGPEMLQPRTGGYLGAEAGAGVLLNGPRALTLDLRLGGGGEVGSDPDALHWFGVGVGLGGRF